MLWKIVHDCSDGVVSFAAQELKRYLSLMDPTQEAIPMDRRGFTCTAQNVLELAVDSSLLPEGADAVFDDAIRIDVAGSCGRITGSNSRSVLIAVYRFLKALGCAWIRPGKDGEYVPRKHLDAVRVSVCERPSYRHRGVTIEGSVNYDHVVNMIDWLPKVGMNAYFIQFPDVPFIFYDRWYSHRENATLKPEPLTPDEIRAIRFSTIDEIKKRGLLYHAAGHGWTCEPFGIPGNTWDAADIPVTEEQRSCLAEVNGKREIWQGIPLNTNLCFSQAAVRNRIAQAVVDYIRRIPQVDVLHVWLADGINNHCECAECAKKLPSEWYVALLNEIDRRMTENGMKQKIVFLLYFDLLWPPKTDKLINPDRFIMMFAPITRTYSASVADAERFDEAKLPAYSRNHLSFPKRVDENIAWLKKWQREVTCDSFDFDYHYMWDHLNDPGYYQMAKILLKDIQGLEKIGMNGLVSCQNQRTWFPSGLGMHLMAEGLWNKNIEFDAAAADYFRMAFGESGLPVRDYLTALSDAFDPRFLRRETGTAGEDDIIRLRQVEQIVDAFLPTVQKYAKDCTLPSAVQKSWMYLKYHGTYCKLLANALIAEVRDVEAEAEMEKFYQWCRIHEMELADVLDVFEIHFAFRRRQEKCDVVLDTPI